MYSYVLDIQRRDQVLLPAVLNGLQGPGSPSRSYGPNCVKLCLLRFLCFVGAAQEGVLDVLEPAGPLLVPSLNVG